MKMPFKTCLAALIVVLLPPPICFAGQKQIWKKTAEQARELTKETYKLVPRGKDGTKTECCNIIVYKNDGKDQRLIVNAYDKNPQGKIFIQEIKIAKDQNGNLEKKDTRWEQECAGGGEFTKRAKMSATSSGKITREKHGFFPPMSVNSFTDTTE